MWALMFLMAYYGFNSCVQSGNFPTVVGREIGKNYIPFVCLTSGAGVLLTSYGWGRLHDAYGWTADGYPQLVSVCA
jgi:hypothetical protein